MKKSLCVLQIPQTVYSGAGSVERLPQMLREKGADDVCLMIDRGVYGGELIKSLIKDARGKFRNVNVVTDIPSEPTEDEVKAVFAEVRRAGCDAVAAIGGGSVIDSAKLVATMLTNEAYRADLTHKEAICKPGAPLVAVPTSAGTGSEATPNAIVLLPEKKLKVGVVHRNFMPWGAILDPRLTVSMPRTVTAATGIDAFCHCIETFISRKSCPFSEVFALKGLELIARNLRRAYENGEDLEAREAMLLAAFYGGAAITASSTVAVHALSYPLGGMYGIAHGVSNAILLVPVMRYNIDAIGEKLAPIARALGLETNGKGERELGAEIIAFITGLVRDVNIPQTLTGFGVTPEDVGPLALAASQVHRLLDQNPKEMSEQDIRAIYTQLL